MDLVLGRISGQTFGNYVSDAWKELDRPDIFVVPIPQNHFTVIASPELCMEFLQAERKYPRGSAADLWPFLDFYGIHSRSAGKAMPFMLAQGEEWRQVRQAFQGEIFRSSSTDAYVPLMQEVCTDAFKQVRAGTSPFLVKAGVLNYSSLASNLAFEMLAYILLGNRLGLIDGTADPVAKGFVEKAQVAWKDFIGLSSLPEGLAKCTTMYKKFILNMQSMEKLASTLIAQASSESVFGRLRTGGQVSEEALISNLVTLLQAGVDTTASTMQFQAYYFATSHGALQKARAEFSEYPSLTAKQLPYWKAFTREVHRMSPTANGILRKNPDADKVITFRNKHIVLEKGSTIFFRNNLLAMEPDFLNGNVDDFVPERWLNEEAPSGSVIHESEHTQVKKPTNVLSHALIATPFGVGARVCAGQQLAERELVIVARHLLKFNQVKLADPAYKLAYNVGLVPVPRDPIVLQLG